MIQYFGCFKRERSTLFAVKLRLYEFNEPGSYQFVITGSDLLAEVELLCQLVKDRVGVVLEINVDLTFQPDIAEGKDCTLAYCGFEPGIDITDKRKMTVCRDQEFGLIQYLCSG